MKSLDQVEPRRPLLQGVSGVDHTNGDYEYVINQSGSYFLTETLAISKLGGIRVDAEGVSLDLMGYSIEAKEGARTAIEVDPQSHGCTIRNGFIRGQSNCLYGIRCPGPGDDWAQGGTVDSVTVSGCTDTAILAGEAWTLTHCVARDNTGSGIRAEAGSVLEACLAFGNTEPAAMGFFAISAGDHSILTRCTATTNTFSGSGAAAIIEAGEGASLNQCTVANNVVSAASGGDGIQVGSGAVVTHCTVRNNALSPSSGSGIDGGSSCMVAHCTVGSNTGGGGIQISSGTVQHCTVSANDGTGISANGNATVQNCTSSHNEFGIIIGITGGAQVLGNTCNHNTQAGIRVSPPRGDTRVDGNSAAENGVGIHINTAGNIVVRNSAVDNTTDYSVVAGNRVGTVVFPAASPAFSGSTGGSGVGTDPWSNFSF